MGNICLFHKMFIGLVQHAYALETLKDHLFEGAHALDVGSGSGYLVACIAQMVCIFLLYLLLSSTKYDYIFKCL